MSKLMFRYKVDYEARKVQYKPYCFKWVLLYRLREFYLWLFWLVANPFYNLGIDMGKIKQGEYFSFRTFSKRCFNSIVLENK